MMHVKSDDQIITGKLSCHNRKIKLFQPFTVCEIAFFIRHLAINVVRLLGIEGVCA